MMCHSIFRFIPKITGNVILFFLFLTNVQSQRDGYHRVIGGYNCSILDHSFMVAIVHGTSDILYFIGGGSLLAERWVLTSRSQLMYCHIANFYTVIAGAQSPSEFGKILSRYVRSSIVTRCYSGPKQANIEMEIALLRLENPIRKGEATSFADWAKKSDLKGQTLENICNPALIMGYGIQLEERISEKEYPNLHCGNIPATAEKVCTTKLSIKTTPKLLGCLFTLNHISACVGDSGGPVMCRGKQYGVMKTTSGCDKTVPTSFIQVAYYDRFIRATMDNFTQENLAKSKCNSNAFLNLFILPFSFILHIFNVKVN